MSKKEIAINTLLNSANKTKKIYPEILSLNNHGNNPQFESSTVRADTACLEDEKPHIN